MATGALGNRIDCGSLDTRSIQLQGNAFPQIKLPVTKADLSGDALPSVGTLTEEVADRTINFIAVSGNPRTDRGVDVGGLTTEDFAHSSNGPLQQAGCGPAPTKMDDSSNMLAPVIKYNRKAVRNKYADQKIALIGNDRITFDALEMRDFRIGLVDHQDFAAMHLVYRQEQVWLQTKAPGHDGAVCLDLGRLVSGTKAKVEGVERRPAAAAIAGGKTGNQIVLTGPGRLHELNLALLNCFHRITFQLDPGEEEPQDPSESSDIYLPDS